jgi:hypothetical protein
MDCCLQDEKTPETLSGDEQLDDNEFAAERSTVNNMHNGQYVYNQESSVYRGNFLALL